jgi:hypothetical protein
MHPHPRRKVQFQPRHDHLESRRLLTTYYSTNWSGYAAATNLSSPASNSVTAVSGSWVVPTVTGSGRGTTYSNVWVGIDGFSNSTVEQIGTEQDVINGVARYDAWWEMYSSGIGQPEQLISGSGFSIKPGDTITASVQYTGSGNFLLTINDTAWTKPFTTTQNTTATQSPTAAQSSAEWIVEAPTVGGRQSSVANFGTVTFSNASATINSTNGPINDAAWQNAAIDMITSAGTPLDSTSSLDSTGTQFTVTYVGSSGTGGGGGGGGHGHGKAQTLTVPTKPVSLAPPTGQATVVVLYGVVPTDQVKKPGPGLAGSSQTS